MFMKKAQNSYVKDVKNAEAVNNRMHVLLLVVALVICVMRF